MDQGRKTLPGYMPVSLWSSVFFSEYVVEKSLQNSHNLACQWETQLNIFWGSAQRQRKKAMISLDINWETSEVLRSKDTVYSNMKHSCIKMFIFSTGSGHYFICSNTVKNPKMMKKLTKDFQLEQSRFTAISNVTTPANVYYSAIRKKSPALFNAFKL